MKSRYIQLISRTLTDAEHMDHALDFEALGVDSFDLLSIRVAFERFLDAEIADGDWTEFRSFSDLFAYCDHVRRGASTTESTGSHLVDVARLFDIGMPQMAMGGIAENWLFRELGDAHWEMLCRGLDRRSSDLQDEMQNRLYATFARVQLRGSESLAFFNESEPASLGGNIVRYGSGMYYSNIALESLSDPGKRIAANLITSFSRRGETGNKNLVKSHPSATINLIENVEEMPEFINEYRLIKKGEVKALNLLDHVFEMSDEAIWEYTYSINPYYDSNGANLLYFASYPTISDYCTLQYLEANPLVAKHSALDYHTLARDVLYFANSDMQDKIIYRLHSIVSDGDMLFTTTSLYRQSDAQLMAKLFTIKRFSPEN